MAISKLKRLTFVLALFIAALVAIRWQAGDRDALYQVSVLDGLAKGDYDGKVKLGRVRGHGDFGVGTFDRLDGEAIELDGVFYQAASNGVVRRMDGDATTPFMMATFFDSDLRFPVSQNPDYGSLRGFIDSRLPTKNIPYAIKIDGTFSHIKVRSVPAQNKPYPALAEVVKRQSMFEFHNIEGTLAGFRMPAYAQGVNMPGYHLHFLSRDKTKGGHALECAVRDAEVSVDSIDRLIVALPASSDFYNLDFSSGNLDVSAYEK